MPNPASSKQRHRAFRNSGYRDPRAEPGSASSNGQPKKPRDRTLTRKYLREYARWLWPYRWALLVVFLLATLTAVLDLIWPLAIKRVIDLLPAPMEYADKARRLNILGASIVGLLLFKQAAEALRSYRTTILNTQVIFKLRRRLYEKLLGLPLAQLSGPRLATLALAQRLVAHSALELVRSSAIGCRSAIRSFQNNSNR